MPEAWKVNRHRPLGGRIRSALSLARLAGPLAIPRGVRKFRSIEEMNADRDYYERLRVARIRERNERLRK